jgi:hypothetical protein
MASDYWEKKAVTWDPSHTDPVTFQSGERVGYCDSDSVSLMDLGYLLEWLLEEMYKQTAS